jgi:hypothetical protein
MKLIDYLCLYKNAKLKTKDGVGILNSINFHNNTCVIDFGERLITYSLLEHDLEFNPIKLVLRTKFNPEEGIIIHRLLGIFYENEIQEMYQNTVSNPDGKNTFYEFLTRISPNVFLIYDIVIGKPDVWSYMLSINLDLFGLIIKKEFAILDNNE